MYRFIIGCDCDGVLTDLYTHNVRAGREIFQREPVDLNAYGVDEVYDISDIPVVLRYAKAVGIFRRYCQKEPPREGALRVINELSGNGYDFHLITARMFADYRGILRYLSRSWLTGWLKSREFNFSSVQICSEKQSPRDKLLACRKLGVDAMIEDRPDNVMYLAENGIRVLMFDAPYNKDISHENVTRVHDWKEVKEILTALPVPSEKGWTRLEREQIAELSDKEKNIYFRLYQRHLQETPFDNEKLEKGENRFRRIYRLLNLPLKLFFHVKAFGKKNIPYQNGFIVICNHCNSYDQYRFGLAFGNRPFVGYAAKEIADTFRGRLFDSTGLCIFIDRNDRTDKHNAAELMASHMAHGRISLIFPEGTRKNKTPEGRAKFQNHFKAGTAVLAQKTGAAILPVACNSFGCRGLVRFGELIYVSPTDDIAEKTCETEAAVAKLSMENFEYYLTKKNRTNELKEVREKYKEYLASIERKESI